MNSDVQNAFDRLHKSIGEVTTIRIGRVSGRDFQKFAFAVGHLDARYVDASIDSAEAPPIYLSAVMGWQPGPAEHALRADGSEPQATGGLELDGLRLMGAGQELEFHKAVRDGMELWSQTSIDSLELKHGRTGDMILIRLRRRYIDQADEAVVSCLETVIAR